MARTYFTLEEANRSLPLVRRIVADLMKLHPRWRELVDRYEVAAGRARPDWGESPEQVALRAQIDEVAREIAACIEIGGIRVGKGTQSCGGTGIVTKVRKFLCLYLFCGGRARQVRFQEFSDMTERQGADELIDYPAVSKQLHGRNAADLELLRDVLVFVGVDLDHLDLARLFVGHLFEHRTQSAARAAPGCPEIHEHGLRRRRVDDFGRKGCRGDSADC